MDEIKDQQTFNKDEKVPEAGDYVCVPCGYRKTFQDGEAFTECISCMSGTPDGEEEYAEGLEMWEKAPNLELEAPQNS